MSKFLLEMLTPEKTFFVGEVDMLTVEALDGELGILAGHAPMVIALDPSMIRIKIGNEQKILANGEGFLQISPSGVTVLCQTMEWPEDIELERVQRAIEEHSNKLKQHLSVAEYKISSATLMRALARMTVKNLRK